MYSYKIIMLSYKSPSSWHLKVTLKKNETKVGLVLTEVFWCRRKSMRCRILDLSNEGVQPAKFSIWWRERRLIMIYRVHRKFFDLFTSLEAIQKNYDENCYMALFFFKYCRAVLNTD